MPSIALGLARPQAGAWWPAGARYAADFINGRYMREGTPIAEANALTLTRASGKWAPDRAGMWHYFGPNVLARTNAGALVEPAGTNLIPNPGLAGAAVGIVGAGGSLPTGWYVNNVLTTEVLAITTSMGLPALRIRVSGAASGVFYELGVSPPSTAIAASTAYHASLFIRVEQGQMPDVQLRQSTTADVLISVAILAALDDTRCGVAFTSSSSAARGRIRVTFTLTQDQTVHSDLLIACPQIEEGGVATSPITSLRMVDALVANLGSYNQTLELVSSGGAATAQVGVSGASPVLVPETHRQTALLMTTLSP